MRGVAKPGTTGSIAIGLSDKARLLLRIHNNAVLGCKLIYTSAPVFCVFVFCVLFVCKLDWSPATGISGHFSTTLTEVFPQL
jgi:ABC-type dipeptide/oligopeptide/nickel transport system permease component